MCDNYHTSFYFIFVKIPLTLFCRKIVIQYTFIYSVKFKESVRKYVIISFYIIVSEILYGNLSFSIGGVILADCYTLSYFIMM